MPLGPAPDNINALMPDAVSIFLGSRLALETPQPVQPPGPWLRAELPSQISTKRLAAAARFLSPNRNCLETNCNLQFSKDSE